MRFGMPGNECIILLCLLYSVALCTESLHRKSNLDFNLKSWTSGITVTDIDRDGRYEVLVAVLQDANVLIRYNPDRRVYEDIAATHEKYRILKDPQARTVAACACDVNGDGIEEIYLHNVNDVYSDVSSYVTPDRLIWMNGEQLRDVFTDPLNREFAPRTGGYSVACIDRNGNGKQAFFVTTFTKDGKGAYSMFVANDTATQAEKGRFLVAEISREANVRLIRDGRGISVGPLVGDDSLSDIFVANDNSYHVGSATFRHDGSNVLLKNNGDGTFTDVAGDYGVEDEDENGQGTAIGYFTDGDFADVMYVNWLGPGRWTTLRRRANPGTATDVMFGKSGPSKLLLTVDLDNDGQTEIIKGNKDGESFYPSLNAILTIKQPTDNKSSVMLEPFNIQDGEFQSLHITGITAADLNMNGMLELFISHRPYNGRTLSVYEHSLTNNNWIRVIPLTKHGAHARGSKVTLTFDGGLEQSTIIGGGCGYMCQMEPVAHFGFGNMSPREVTVTWPDGHSIRKFLQIRDLNKLFALSYNGNVRTLTKDAYIESSTSTGTSEVSNIGIAIISFHVVFMYILAMFD